MGKDIALDDKEKKVIKYCIDLAIYKGSLTNAQIEVANEIVTKMFPETIDISKFDVIEPARARWEKRMRNKEDEDNN